MIFKYIERCKRQSSEEVSPCFPMENAERIIMAREKRLKLSELTDEEYQELYEYETEQERKGLKRLGFFFCLMELLMSALLMFQIYETGFLPLNFMIVVGAVLLLLFVLTVLLVSRKRKWIKIIGLLLTLVLFLLLAVVNFYTYKVYHTLSEVTGAEYKVDNMVVVVRQEDKAKTIQDAGNYTFAVNTSENAQNLSRMKANVEKQIGGTITVQEYPNVIEAGKALIDKDVDAAIYNTAYDALIADNMEDYLDRVRVLYQYEIKTEVETKDEDEEHVRSVDKPFNLYISGIDTLGKISTTSRSDVNMIMTVNPQTHTILMTNTPRDYFVLLPNISGTTRDKLTHAGIYGIDACIDTMEALYDTDLDYYIRVNFTSLVTLIDAMGGIDINSDYEFNCLWKGYHINKGMNHLNGDQTLGYIRERYAFPDGDNQRVKNEQAVMEAIIDQLTTATGITSAPRLLSVLSDCMETDMTQDEFSKLINRQISDGGKWTIEKQAVSGQGDMQATFSGGSQELFVMWPDDTAVGNAAKKIQQVLDEEGDGSGGSDSNDENTPLPFTDVKEGDWYYGFVKDVFNKGLMSGNDDGTFGLDTEVTRVQMCIMLQALAGGSNNSELTEPFADVADDVWYHDAVAWAYQNGLVDGVTSTDFEPNQTVTRSQLLLMLYRYAGSPEVTGDLSQFNDSVNIDPIYSDAIIWAVQQGLCEGDDSGAFHPNKVATRLDTAVILSKISSISKSQLEATETEG